MKIFGITIRRRIGKREDELCHELGHGFCATDELIERQLTKASTTVNCMKVFISKRNIKVVGRISITKGGPMTSYKLSPYFTQVIWADGRRGTKSHPTWEAACTSLLGGLTDRVELLSNCDFIYDYHTLIVRLVEENFTTEVPTAQEVSMT